MASLTPSDVKRWDPDAIHQVFQTASNRAQTLQKLGDSLQQVHNGLSDWQGEAGDAFRADLGNTRRDIEADGHESRQVATAVSAAEADVRACRTELDNIQQMADANHWAITPDWRIDTGNTMKGPNSGLLAIELQTLQSALAALKMHAYSTDHELATAVRSAVGEAPASARSPVSGGAPQPQQQPTPQAGQPKSLQDMLLPTGAANADDAAKGSPVPAGAGSGKAPSLQDMMLGKGTAANQKPPAGDPLDLLGRLPRPGARAGGPAPRLDPAAIESFKAMTRQSMIREGVRPDQIDARVNQLAAQAQQWLDNGAPPPPPAPSAPAPKPGFGDGFADHWFGFEDAVHRLTGQEGLDAMGDAWGGMAKGFAGKAEDLLLQGPVAPINDLTHEFKSFLDNPAYYAGGKAADGAIALPGMLLGPEGAGLGEASAAARAGGLSDLDGVAGIAAHDLPGLHPSSDPLEALLGGGHPSGTPEPPLAGVGHEPSGPLETPFGGGHPGPEPTQNPVLASHPSDQVEPPLNPNHSLSDPANIPAAAPSSPAEVSVGGGHPVPDPSKVPVAAGHMPSPAETLAGGGHPSSGPPVPTMSGGHPPEAPPPGGPSSSSAEPPASRGHPPTGPAENPLPHGADHTPAHVPAESQWAPVGHDQPITYHEDAPRAALDLSDAAQQHLPTADLSQRVADMSTHYIGENPDRVVLGKWAGDEKGYIGEARAHGGIYYDTSTEVWNNIGHGLEKPVANDLGWEVNEKYLRTQMERGVGRLDYVLNDSGFSSIEQVVRDDPNSFSAREIKFLTENAKAYGYERIGNSWIRMRGGQP